MYLSIRRIVKYTDPLYGIEMYGFLGNSIFRKYKKFKQYKFLISLVCERSNFGNIKFLNNQNFEYFFLTFHNIDYSNIGIMKFVQNQQFKKFHFITNS